MTVAIGFEGSANKVGVGIVRDGVVLSNPRWGWDDFVVHMEYCVCGVRPGLSRSLVLALRICLSPESHTDGVCADAPTASRSAVFLQPRARVWPREVVEPWYHSLDVERGLRKKLHHMRDDS
jgi:hypothetical protein